MMNTQQMRHAQQLELLKHPLSEGPVWQACECHRALMSLDPAARHFFSVKVRNQKKMIPLPDVYYLHAEQKYTMLGFVGGELLLEESLAHFEHQFPKHFLRIHRSTLVHLPFIHTLDVTNTAFPRLLLKETKRTFLVSRRKLLDVRQSVAWLETLYLRYHAATPSHRHENEPTGFIPSQLGQDRSS